MKIVNIEKRIVAAVFVFLSIAVFYFQPYDVFFGGGHFGWVSAHTLAIIHHATIERTFLGFTCEFSDAPAFKYFDRYPILFSGFMNLLLQAFKADFGDYVSWARVYMNVIYLASIFLGYKIALLFTRDRYVSLLSTIFTFSGVLFIFYKDMIHFDQPAVLGMLLLFYTISRYEMYQDKKWLWLSVGAVLLGRGYASNFLLLFWNIIFVVELLLQRKFSFFVFLNSTQFKAFVLGGILSVSALGFNIYSESRILDVSWKGTSIVKSAKFRLSGSRSKSPKTHVIPFAEVQLKRTIGGLIPYALYPYQRVSYPYYSHDKFDFRRLRLIAYFLLLAGLLLLSLRKEGMWQGVKQKKGLVILGLFAGFFWLFPMRGLAAFHDYTHMYNAIFYILVFSAIFYFFKTNKAALGMIGLALAVFVLSLNDISQVRIKSNPSENAINGDIDKIRSYLQLNGLDDIYIDGGYRNLIKGSPYASCLYFSDFKIARDAKDASVIVSRKKSDAKELLPDMDVLHLYQL